MDCLRGVLTAALHSTEDDPRVLVEAAAVRANWPSTTYLIRPWAPHGFAVYTNDNPAKLHERFLSRAKGTRERPLQIAPLNGVLKLINPSGKIVIFTIALAIPPQRPNLDRVNSVLVYSDPFVGTAAANLSSNVPDAAATIIQAHRRGQLARRAYWQKMNEKYRPGGAGYAAAKSRFSGQR